MKFNELVKAHLYPIFQKYNFKIIRDSDNVVYFESSTMEINIVFNIYDLSHLIEIGGKGEMLYPLSDNVLKRYWGTELSINNITSEIFVKNLSFLFEQPQGIEILKGHIRTLLGIIDQECKNYTNELLQRQTLGIALKAWKDKDYETFIKHIEKIDISILPKQYQLMYKIAIKKLL